MVAVIRYRLSYPVQSERKEKQRPLTPVLTVHSRPARREVIVYANCRTLPRVFVSLNLHLSPGSVALQIGLFQATPS